MIYEIDLCTNSPAKKAFIQNGVFHSGIITRIIHNHSYAEIHIIADGCADFYIDGEVRSFSQYDCFIVPAGMYHCCKNAEAQTRHIAFQLTADCVRPSFGRLSPEITAELSCVLADMETSAGCAKLSALLSYVCADFFADNAPKIKEMSDTAATIHEFISKSYNLDIKLSDLAKELHFSEKQTERLIKKHSGTTFKTLLTRYRMTVADFLKKNTEMSETEIAEYVGYSTYNGYWKAKKKLAEE